MRFDKFFFLLLQTFAYYTSDSSLPVFHSSQYRKSKNFFKQVRTVQKIFRESKK